MSSDFTEFLKSAVYQRHVKLDVCGLFAARSHHRGAGLRSASTCKEKSSRLYTT